MEKLGSPEPARPLPGAGPVAGAPAAKMAVDDRDEEALAVSSKLFRCACVRRWISLAYREELYQVLRLTGPLVSGVKLKCRSGGGKWGRSVRYLQSSATALHLFCLLLCGNVAVKSAVLQITIS